MTRRARFSCPFSPRQILNAAVLNALREKGADGSPEAISTEALALVQNEWLQLRQVGILRFLRERSVPDIALRPTTTRPWGDR